MENVRIASTPLVGLRPVGPAANRDYDRLIAGLSALSAVSDDLLRLFGEPVPSRDRSRTDWYGPGDRIYTPLESLPDDQRAAGLAKLDELLALLRVESERLHAAGDPEGDFLTAAMTVPSPRERYVYIAREIGRPENWLPVLIGWAHTNDVRSRVGALPKIMVRETVRPVVPARAAVGTVSLATAPAMVVAGDGPGRAWRWLLWLALTLLLLIIAWMLLRACGMGLPGYGVLHHIGEAFCPGTALAAVPSEASRARALDDLARKLEIELVQKQIACAIDTRRAETGQSPPDQPLPGNSDIDKRLKDAKAGSGEFQVSLAWDGNADLDLHVFCPSGEEISYSIRSSCGGTLDVDMNGPNNQSPTPVENAFWPDGKAPNGKFKIAVNLYDRKGDMRPAIPFQLRIKEGANVRTVPGTVGEERKLVDVTEISR